MQWRAANCPNILGLRKPKKKTKKKKKKKKKKPYVNPSRLSLVEAMQNQESLEMTTAKHAYNDKTIAGRVQKHGIKRRQRELRRKEVQS